LTNLFDLINNYADARIALVTMTESDDCAEVEKKLSKARIELKIAISDIIGDDIKLE
jgi:hypothetical protein